MTSSVKVKLIPPKGGWGSRIYYLTPQANSVAAVPVTAQESVPIKVENSGEATASQTVKVEKLQRKLSIKRYCTYLKFSKLIPLVFVKDRLSMVVVKIARMYKSAFSFTTFFNGWGQPGASDVSFHSLLCSCSTSSWLLVARMTL